MLVEIARIANLSLKLGYRLEAENRPLTKEEASVQPGHSTSLLNAVLYYAKAKLARRESRDKEAFTVLLTQNDKLDGSFERLLHTELGGQHELRFMYFTRVSELVRLAEAQTFDLILFGLADAAWDIGYGDLNDLLELAESERADIDGTIVDLLRSIKTRYGKQVVVTHGLKLTKHFEEVGVRFLQTPFDDTEFSEVWNTLLPDLMTRRPSQYFLRVAICGLSPDREIFTEMLAEYFKDSLPEGYTAQFLNFTYTDQFIEMLRYWNFDFFIIILNPYLVEFRNFDEKWDAPATHKLVAELRAQSQRPIVILTNESRYRLESVASFQQAGADAFLSFLPGSVPPFRELFKQTLKRCVGAALSVRTHAAHPAGKGQPANDPSHE